MLNKSLPLILAAVFALPASATDWMLDSAHTDIGFTIRHMMVSDTRGAFDKYDGVIKVDDKDPTKSVVDITIETASVNTKNDKRDTHLKSPDFFDAVKFPKMTFKSKSVAKGDKPNMFKVTGDLTIKDVTKSVVLDVETTDVWMDPKEWGGNSHRGVKATTKINRQDFGLKFQQKLDKGGVVLADDVMIAINAELLMKPADAPKK